MQRGHAPCGELNEKIRGSSSGIDVPHFRQENFSEKTSVPADSRAPFAPVECGFGALPDVPSHHGSTSTMPSASATAVSTESASRLRTSGFICEAVHDHRDVVLVLLVELDLVLEPAQLAVDLGAGEALGAQLLEQVLVLALAARGRPAPAP